MTAVLKTEGYNISYVTISTLLHELGYSLQVNHKAIEKSSHEDRNSQFLFITEVPHFSVEVKRPNMTEN